MLKYDAFIINRRRKQIMKWKLLLRNWRDSLEFRFKNFGYRDSNILDKHSSTHPDDVVISCIYKNNYTASLVAMRQPAQQRCRKSCHITGRKAFSVDKVKQNFKILFNCRAEFNQCL